MKDSLNYLFSIRNLCCREYTIPGPTLFLLYINDLPDDVICDIVIYADHTTLYS